MIQLTDVSKTYDGETFAVRNLNLEVADGEFVVLLGESGCGKTTTMKMINRLIERTSGGIEVNGKDVRDVDPIQLRRHIGYAFQRIGLFPHMSVGANVEIVPRLLGWPRDRIQKKRDQLLQLVKLPPEQFRRRRPSELSGGQQQRVGLARALAGEPGIMLLDEPFGALDPVNRDRLQDEYRQIHDKFQLTTVMVTHDISEALLLADRIAVMNMGGIVQLATPSQLISQPADEYVEQLVAAPKRQARRLVELSSD
jgi:osmoprotectant transport system ATP-binding protein